jgi:Cof subfamily protein (haloacid dehalogenase superfamily)
MTLAKEQERWLIAIDIDGTLVHDDGYMSPAVAKEVQRVRDLGHIVVVATGRSAANGFPVIRDIGIQDGFAVCANGAVTIEVDPLLSNGFRQHEVITFDPRDVLGRLTEALPKAHFAVEKADGSYLFHRPFPTYALGENNVETPLHELSAHPVSRVVVLSPDQEVGDFLDTVERIGLQSVSYAIGYTAWLDIAPQGVNKASALEKLRVHHDIRADQVIAIGDGRNDINMFEWAQAGGGIGFAMAQGPEEVRSAAAVTTSSVEDDGVARVLSGFEGILFSRSLG